MRHWVTSFQLLRQDPDYVPALRSWQMRLSVAG